MNADKIRVRCASPEAAEYTLYVRGLIDEYYGSGGQAEILRVAGYQGILPAGGTRQWLSEQLGGRYRHGPSWPVTELIIKCLPGSVDRPALLTRAWALFQAAQRHNPRAPRPAERGPANNGPRPDAPTSPGRHRQPNSGNRFRPEQGARRPVSAASADGSATGDASWRARAQQEADRADRAEARARELELRLQAGRALQLRQRLRDVPPEQAAGLRETCALLVVDLARSGGLVGGADAGVSDPAVQALLELNRNRFIRRIDPAAPPARRSVASYLGTHAELLGLTGAELARAAGLEVDRVRDILAARKTPTEGELAVLARALDALPRTVLTLAGAGRHQRQ